jgi:hypothetical protein
MNTKKQTVKLKSKRKKNTKNLKNQDILPYLKRTYSDLTAYQIQTSSHSTHLIMYVFLSTFF